MTLPAVLPGVFTLLRMNFIAAWMAVLVAEMVGLRDGLGAIMMMGRNLFNNDLIMFGMLLIGVSRLRRRPAAACCIGHRAGVVADRERDAPCAIRVFKVDHLTVALSGPARRDRSPLADFNLKIAAGEITVCWARRDAARPRLLKALGGFLSAAATGGVLPAGISCTSRRPTS